MFLFNRQKRHFYKFLKKSVNRVQSHLKFLKKIGSSEPYWQNFLKICLTIKQKLSPSCFWVFSLKRSKTGYLWPLLKLPWVSLSSAFLVGSTLMPSWLHVHLVSYSTVSPVAILNFPQEFHLISLTPRILIPYLCISLITWAHLPVSNNVLTFHCPIFTHAFGDSNFIGGLCVILCFARCSNRVLTFCTPASR